MKKTGILIILLAISVVFLGQSSQTISLTLQQAKAKAIENNLQLQNSSYEVQIAKSQQWQTIASMLPQVFAGYDYQNMMGFKMDMRIPARNPVTGEPMVTVIEREMPPTGTLSLTAGLQISGQQIVGSMINKIAVDMAKINNRQTEQNAVSTTTQLYITALANKHIVTLLDSSRVNIQKIYSSALQAVKIGVLEQTEADKINIQVMKLQSAINAAQRGLEVIYNSLKLHLGIASDIELTLVDSLDRLTDAESSLNLLHSDFVLSDNYSYQLMKSNLEMSKKQIAMASAMYAPTLNIGYRFSNVKYFGGEPMMNMNPPHVMTIGVKVPLFTSGRTLGSIQEKKFNYLKNKNQLDLSKNQLEIQNKQLRYNLNSAYENFQIQKQNMVLAGSVFGKVSEKFRYGKASSMEVTQANTDLISSQNSYIQSLIEMTNAQIALRNLLNK